MAKSKTKKPITLTNIELRILTLCATNGNATLADMTSMFKRRAAAAQPGLWNYATEVAKGARVKWSANLLARNGIRKPTRLGLLRKVKPGLYAITAAGRRAVAS